MIGRLPTRAIGKAVTDWPRARLAVVRRPSRNTTASGLIRQIRADQFHGLGKLLGGTLGARIAIVILTATLFGLAHVPEQGLAGAEQAMVVGLVFGTILAKTRSLAPLMVTHAAFDLTAVALIYWRLESAVAHAVLR